MALTRKSTFMMDLVVKSNRHCVNTTRIKADDLHALADT